MPVPFLGIAAAIAGEFAPDLLRYLAGDAAGSAAERIVDAAREATGAESGDDALAALRADPRAAADFALGVRKLDADLEKAYLGDRQDARGRDVDLRRAGYRNLRADLMVLSAFLTLIVIVCVLWAYTDIPQSVLAIFTMMAGQILKMLSDAFQFEFGSSRGSKEKGARLGEY